MEHNKHNDQNPSPSETAFPVPDAYTHKGATLRQFFAAFAVTGVILHQSKVTNSLYNADEIAQQSFAIADAMLKRS